MDATWLLSAIMAISSSPFLVGFLITFLFTLFPGPMNAVVIDQMLEKGIKTGVVTLTGNCLGGVTSVFIGSLPFLFGITFLADWISANMTAATVVMAVTLLAIGLHMMFSKIGAARKAVYAFWAYCYTSLHPGNLLVNTALVATLQAQGTMTSGWSVFALMLGYLAGCGSCWVLYALIIAKTKKNISAVAVNRFKYVMGSFLVIAALFTIGSVLFA